MKTIVNEIGKFQAKYSKDFLISLISKVSSQVFTLFTFALLTRNLTQTDFGLFSLGQTTFSILAMLLAFGGPALLSLEYSNKSENNLILLNSIKSLQLSIFAISFIILFFLTFYFSKPLLGQDISSFFFYFLLAIPFFNLLDVNSLWVNLQGSIGFSQLIKSGVRPILLFCLVGALFLFNQVNLTNAALVFFLAALFSFLVFINYQKIPKFQWNLSHIKQFRLKHSFNNILISSVVTLMLSMDSYFIAHYLQAEQIALYSVGARLVIIVTFLALVIDPIMINRITINRDKNLSQISSDLLKLSITMSLVWLLVFVLFATVGNNIFLLFGDYTQANFIFLLLLLGRIFDICCGQFSYVININNKSHWLLGNTIVTVFINLITNYILIKEYGVIGVAMATTISYFFQATLRFIQLHFLLKIKTFRTFMIPVGICLISMLYLYTNLSLYW